MANTYFQFKQFTIHQNRCAMKVTTDGCLFGAWCAERISGEKRASADKKLVLDIGTGTGLLSLMVAQKTDVTIEAIELNNAAAQQAKENVAASRWKESIIITQADVLQWNPNMPSDYILSNPPFYENDLKSPGQQKNLAHHNDGLTLSELLQFINLHLQPEGFFFLLLPAKREKDLLLLLAENGLHSHQRVYVRQSTAHNPFRLMLQGGKNKSDAIVSEELPIKDENGNYTPAFTSLLKDYYLYL